MCSKAKSFVDFPNTLNICEYHRDSTQRTTSLYKQKKHATTQTTDRAPPPRAPTVRNTTRQPNPKDDACVCAVAHAAEPALPQSAQGESPALAGGQMSERVAEEAGAGDAQNEPERSPGASLPALPSCAIKVRVSRVWAVELNERQRRSCVPREQQAESSCLFPPTSRPNLPPQQNENEDAPTTSSSAT